MPKTFNDWVGAIGLLAVLVIFGCLIAYVWTDSDVLLKTIATCGLVFLFCVIVLKSEIGGIE